PERADTGQSRHRRGNIDRSVRPEPGGRRPHPLALLPRSTHRRLRRPHQAIYRFMTTTGQSRPGYQETPAEAGFRMPAEWAPHRGTWLSWPHRESSWPGKVHLIPTVFGEIVRHLAGREEVHINVADAAMEASARLTLAHANVPTNQVFFHHHVTNDAWCRDHGPIFIQRERNGRNDQIILDWGFNAWGNKYPPFEDDDRIPTLIGEKFN